MKPTPDQDDYYTELLQEFSLYTKRQGLYIMHFRNTILNFLEHRHLLCISDTDTEYRFLVEATISLIYNNEIKRFQHYRSGKFVKL